MEKYEYYSDNKIYKSRNLDLELTQLSALGWELVAVDNFIFLGICFDTTYIFKRKLCE